MSETITFPTSTVYTTTVKMVPFTVSEQEWVTYNQPQKAKSKPEPKPTPVIISMYTEEERASYMVHIEAIKELLKAAKWKGIEGRNYKTQKLHNHKEDFLLLAEKKDYYFRLFVYDSKSIEIVVEDPMCEKVHSFYLDFETELDKVTIAAKILIEYTDKILALLKELRSIKTNSRKFIIDCMLPTL